MNTLAYIFSSLKHNARLHLGTLAASAVVSAVLVGALAVGDSVRGSLELLAGQRLGSVNAALFTGSRFHQEELVSRVEEAAGLSLVPFLGVEGVLLTPGGREERRSVSRINVLGVNEDFWGLALAADAATMHPADGEMVVDERTAARLGLKAGQEAVLRLEIPSLLPRDAPLSARGERDTMSRALVVSALADNEHHGRFGLSQTQLPPRNVIVPLKWLQSSLSREGAINGLLSADRSASLDDLRQAIDRALSLPGAGLVLAEAGSGDLVLTSSRVFLEPGVAAKALSLPGASGLLHYLGIELGVAGEGQTVPDDRALSTPYPFLAAATPASEGAWSPVPDGMGDDEIMVNSWTAGELSLAPGDSVDLSYYRLTADNRLVPETRTYSVRGILSMADALRSAEAVPAYPGLSDVDRCRDWEIGMPLDPDRLADPDIQRYWERYRMAPKAFVTLAAGQSMWGNRFGNLTAVRYPAGNQEQAAAELASLLGPGDLGLVFSPVRSEALEGVDAAMDLGDLFLGLGFFLVASALILTALLFSFSVLRRLSEMGTLMAMGFTRTRVAWLVLAEGALLAAAGAAAGVAPGLLYTRGILSALAGQWSGAVSGTALVFSVNPGTVVAGAAAAFICSLAAMAFSLRRVLKMTPRSLLAGNLDQGVFRPLAAWPGPAAALLMAAAVVLTVSSPGGGPGKVALFFSAGVTLLASCLLFMAWLMGRQRFQWRTRMGLIKLGAIGLTRRPGRSLALTAMVAVAVFLVVSVSAMRQDSSSLAGGSSSGVGGFSLVVETSIPVTAGWQDGVSVAPFSLPAGSSLVPLKSGPGDDASCFNLNRVIRPRVMGVDPNEMSARGAFLKPGKEDAWQLLSQELTGGEIPALAGDLDTAMWNLRVAVGPEKGEKFLYLDSSGGEITVRLVGTLPQKKTVLQGKLLISLENFNRVYPDRGGWRYMLVDSPPADTARVKALLEEDLARYGADIVPAASYLASFYEVENTYLAVFLVLGGLGLILGTAGVGAVVLRNTLERQGELALLMALGFTRGQVSVQLAREYMVLLFYGLGAGTISALLAVRPTVAAAGGSIPWVALAILAAAMAAVGAVSISLAAAAAVKGPLVQVLGRE
jgi:ABC-type lipoprotein release transport system permease subunit